jgi:hypothetical protein
LIFFQKSESSSPSCRQTLGKSLAGGLNSETSLTTRSLMSLSHWQLQLLDHILLWTHFAAIAINLGGWAFPQTRRFHRWVLATTASSWLLGGVFYGLGYCFLTDWHWDVKRSLGETQLPASFIQYTFQNYLHLHIPDFWIDVLTGAVFVLILTITLGQIARELRSGPTQSQ